jgi:murein DD-endopeptidase MepM/ murein hydrolase activator NlpD
LILSLNYNYNSKYISIKLKIKKTLIEILLLLIKGFVFIKKLISWFFSYFFKKPLLFIFNLLLYKQLIKVYHLYRNTKKKVNKNNSHFKRIIFKKGMLHIIIAIIIVSILLYQNISVSPVKASANKLHNTVMAELVVSEFAQLPPEEELIEESRSNTNFNPSASKINQELGLITPEINIKTKSKEEEFEDLNLEMSQETAINLQKEAEKFGSNLGLDQIVDENDSVASIKNKRTKTISYKVKPGDVVSSIANKFGISVNTILWENNLSSRSIIHPGDTLQILPVSGISHTVSAGENISYIANKYDVSASEILEVNNISNVDTLKIGQKLLIPGASKISTTSTTNIYNTNSRSSGIDVIKDLIKPRPATTNSDNMLWPTVGHRITQYYSWRHTGLDIANKIGTPLYASEAGTVEYAGWSTGYGYNVLVNHGGGKKTRYAHASKLYVKRGEIVEKGETLAAMGSTGWSTGPHIHFEVIIDGVKLNPLNYIK